MLFTVLMNTIRKIMMIMIGNKKNVLNLILG